MAVDTVLPKPDPGAFDRFIQSQAAALPPGDKTPATRKEWDERRLKLRERLLAAIGTVPDKPCPLEAKVLGTLKRPGYVVERLVFQTMPDVWMTANAYVPDPVKGKLPAVLSVHGHGPWGRRDDENQSRCLGLVKLGFF